MGKKTLIAADKALKELQVAGQVCRLRRARKRFKCNWSGLPILPGEGYYCITLVGAGLGGKKFPDRVKVEYIDDYLNKNIKGGRRQNGST